MDFDRLFALAIAAFCLMMIASFVGLVALVSWRNHDGGIDWFTKAVVCLLYTSPSPRDRTRSRMPSSA